MRNIVLAAFVAVVSFPTYAEDRATPVSAQRPGYGVVESVTTLKPRPIESASAGSSSRSRAQGTYLLRVRLDDGSIQVRSQKSRAGFKVGKRVLLTNAGDVVPE